jgi:NADPH:quinone reductase-like Zn-dependent oxidoreductase
MAAKKSARQYRYQSVSSYLSDNILTDDADAVYHLGNVGDGMQILITGATGKVGQALLAALPRSARCCTLATCPNGPGCRR